MNADAGQRGPLRVGTYNLHGCTGLDGRTDPARIASVLDALDADVVALQEVGTRHGDGPSQLDFLARETGMEAIPGPTIEMPGGWYGNAVLSRLPVLDSRRIDLSRPRREPRCALDLRIDLDGRTVRVVAAHLGLDGGERAAQVQRLCQELTPIDGPVVLLGDFNEWQRGSVNLRLLDAHLGRSPAIPSFPARFPVLALDRIWAWPPSLLHRVRVHWSQTTQVASDHLPLEAELDL